MKKVVVIAGPTSSGKSDLAVLLAQKYNGEIISADSRQVYTGLDIGSGKITKKEMRGIPHHLLDVANPKRKFTVTQYKKLVEKTLRDVLKRNKLPIIVGGTGFYIQAIVDGIEIPQVKPDKVLRKKLEKKSTEELADILQKLDIHRFKTIDIKNPHRLIRAIEIATHLGEVPVVTYNPLPYTFLQIGLLVDKKKLQEKIHTRLIERVKKGMVDEAKTLQKQGLSFKRMVELGLEYKYLALYLQEKITKEEFFMQLETAIRQYSKRQMTWLKKDQRIKWFDAKKIKYIEKEVTAFLSSSKE